MNNTTGEPPRFTFTCLFCGGELSYHGNDMANEVYGDYEDDNAAVISYLKCRKCGRNYEVVDPNKEERENDYKAYWE